MKQCTPDKAKRRPDVKKPSPPSMTPKGNNKRMLPRKQGR